MLQIKFLITHGYVHILSLIPQNNTFWCLGQHSQTITGFKTKFLTMNGKNFIYFLLHCADVQISKNMIFSQRNLGFPDALD